MTLSLRARLLLGLVALVVAGMAISGIATYASLQNFLIQRTDLQLQNGRFVAINQLLAQPGHRPLSPPSPSELPTGTYAELRAPDGSTVLGQKLFGYVTQASSAHPVLPSRVSAAGPDQPVMTTVAGVGGVHRYRVMAMSLDDAGGAILVLAVPLGDVESTLGQLLVLEVSISALVLLGMALLAWWIIRIGLSPLDRMGETAAAIAAGDLSRRVEPATPRTEIGRLGLALNAMLTQIERAFAERTASERRLRRFVADASHELRTPLTSIRGYAELLRRGAARSPGDAALARRRIEEEAIRMTSLVEDMLVLARLDQGRPLERESVDLAVIAHDAGSDARAVAPQRPITVDAGEPVVVAGDEMRLRQVVGNLVRNALVHTPPETAVEVTARAQDGHAVLSVTDHGAGLDDQQVRHIFEPFYRADAGRSRDRGGAGLGLSIVSAVVAAHGGTIDVRPTEGGGATFVVRLPLAGGGRNGHSQL